MNKRHFLAALLGVLVLATGCTTTGPGASDPATRRQSIDSGVDNALANLYRQDPGAQQLVSRARGVLVFPSVLEAGFVFGAWRGDGALRKGGKTVSFHRTTGGSFGLQAGAQSTAVFLLFMTDEALARFESQQGLDGRGRCIDHHAVGRRERAGDQRHCAAAGHRLRALEPGAHGRRHGRWLADYPPAALIERPA